MGKNFKQGLLRNKFVDNVASLLGRGVGLGGEFGEAGGADGEGAQAAVLGGDGLVHLGGGDGPGGVHGDQHRDLPGAHAAVGRNGQFAGLAAIQPIRDNGGPGIDRGLLFGGLRLRVLLGVDVGVGVVLLLDLIAPGELLGEALRVAVELLGVGAAVVLEGGAVHDHVADHGGSVDQK